MFIRNMIFIVGSLLFTQQAASGIYHTTKNLCDGFPQVKVETIKGTCLGLVIQDKNKKRFKKPRKIVSVDGDGTFLVTDMGGWSDNKGTLFLIAKSGGQYDIQVLLEKLNLPHGLEKGPNNTFLLGEKDKIVEFELKDNKVHNLNVVVKDLPAWDKHLHPLTHFILDSDNNLIVNTAASTDQCLDSKLDECAFSKEAGLRKYHYNSKSKSWSNNFEILASGLRNSMALAFHPSGTILQAENSMDFKNAGEPYEEINVIEPKGFYGWPYCYNKNAVNAAWINKKDVCSSSEQYNEPYTLLPPHVAPLDMLYYDSDLIPELSGKLLMSWHGYRIVGNRIVAYDVDRFGKPILRETAYFYRDPYKSSKFTKHQFKAAGGTGKVAQHLEVTTKWNSVDGVRPEGAPVGMTVASDGSIWIVDDKNQSVLRLSRGAPYKGELAAQDQENIVLSNIVLPNNVQKIVSKHCHACHSKSDYQSWFEKVGGRYLAEQRIFHDKERPMPINSTLNQKERSELQVFFEQLRK